MHCVLTVGEGLDPPVNAVRFRRNAENIGTFSRREGQDPPLQCFMSVSETDRQTPFFLLAGLR